MWPRTRSAAPGRGNGNLTGETYAIDKTAPAAISIVARGRQPHQRRPALSWTVTFNESVTGVGTTDFALAATGPSGAAITAVSGQRHDLHRHRLDRHRQRHARPEPRRRRHDHRRRRQPARRQPATGNGNLHRPDLHDRQDRAHGKLDRRARPPARRTPPSAELDRHLHRAGHRRRHQPTSRSSRTGTTGATISRRHRQRHDLHRHRRERQRRRHARTEPRRRRHRSSTPSPTRSAATGTGNGNLRRPDLHPSTRPPPQPLRRSRSRTRSCGTRLRRAPA